MGFNSISDSISAYKDAVTKKTLPYFECNSCDHKFPYPRTSCPKCGSKDVELKLASGKGRIFTMTVLYRAPDPTKKAPFVVAIVELLEGVKVVGNVAHDTNLSIGDEVVLHFGENAERIPRLVFDRRPYN